MASEFTFVKAVRKAAPMIIMVSGTSGSGKTFSALLLAAGIAGPKGKVALIDTENGRGAMYADAKLIMAALPDGYQITQMDAPFEPARYVAALTSSEEHGNTVTVVDSGSHEWEGIGGCSDIAERFANKTTGQENWKMAKKEHKKFLYHCLSTSTHLIICLRARDKVKMAKNDKGKLEVIPMGLQPICEKSFIFEALVSLQIDESTHKARPLKVPDELKTIFPLEGKLLTKEDGIALQEWNSRGAVVTPLEQLQKRARAMAENGTVDYVAFFNGLTVQQKKSLADTTHAQNKEIATRADKESAEAEAATDGESSTYQTVDSFPEDGKRGQRVMWSGQLYQCESDGGNFVKVEKEAA